MKEFVKCKVALNENKELVLEGISEATKEEIANWLGRRKNAFLLVSPAGLIIAKYKYDVLEEEHELENWKKEKSGDSLTNDDLYR
jgi:hypothetical protein